MAQTRVFPISILVYRISRTRATRAARIAADGFCACAGMTCSRRLRGEGPPSRFTRRAGEAARSPPIRESCGFQPLQVQPHGERMADVLAGEFLRFRRLVVANRADDLQMLAMRQFDAARQYERGMAQQAQRIDDRIERLQQIRVMRGAIQCLVQFPIDDDELLGVVFSLASAAAILNSSWISAFVACLAASAAAAPSSASRTA